MAFVLCVNSAVIDGHVRFTVPGDWLQGRTAFGGLASVFAVQAMHDLAGAAWPADVTLRSLQTNFIAPVEGGPVDIVVDQVVTVYG